jgi:hypothetical protein
MDHYFFSLINGGGPLRTNFLLKATCNAAPSAFAFNFDLRRYTTERQSWPGAVGGLKTATLLVDGFVHVLPRGAPTFCREVFGGGGGQSESGRVPGRGPWGWGSAANYASLATGAGAYTRPLFGPM